MGKSFIRIKDMETDKSQHSNIEPLIIPNVAKKPMKPGHGLRQQLLQLSTHAAGSSMQNSEETSSHARVEVPVQLSPNHPAFGSRI